MYTTDMAESSSSNGAASQQAQHTTATPLQLHMWPGARPSESIDIERLLSSSYYPGSDTNYTFNGPVHTQPPLPQATLAKNSAQSPSSSAGTGTVFVDDDNVDFPERRAIEPEFPDNDKVAKNKKKAPAPGKAAGTKRKSDAGDNEGPGEVR